MTKKLAIATIAMMGALIGIARAGYKSSEPVTLGYNSTFAYGSVADARSNSDSSMVIGCSVSSNGSSTSAYCRAGTSTWYHGCMTSNPSLVSIAAAATGDSYLYFAWDSNYNCTFISVDNDSSLSPKQL